MAFGKDITFGAFRLDSANECLWQGERAIALRPKAFAVLKLLVENSGQLVTKQQVLDAVWPGTFVSDAVLKDSVRQLREALDDDADAPVYIETAHRRGYRFIGKISQPAHASSVGEASAATAAVQATKPIAVEAVSSAPACPGFFGREAELAKLSSLLERACAGERQIVFVTGEAGIGKTTLVQELLAQAASTP